MPTEFHCHRYEYHLSTEDQRQLVSLLNAHTKGSRGDAPSFEYRIPPEPYGTSFGIDPCERLKAVVSILCTYSNEVLFNRDVSHRVKKNNKKKSLIGPQQCGKQMSPEMIGHSRHVPRRMGAG
ncbi:hypothetical protein NPIL_691991 [Nephila pilipes]|uniref:Uncharacterized protein n=1 Tax=Nephila pilipes TaxID=299642 RepID=A0A8X6NYC9_NEPPI|nr:hypothetical protein NPIL_691991 [Nephila pilipes]